MNANTYDIAGSVAGIDIPRVGHLRLIPTPHAQKAYCPYGHDDGVYRRAVVVHDAYQEGQSALL